MEHVRLLRALDGWYLAYDGRQFTPYYETRLEGYDAWLDVFFGRMQPGAGNTKRA